MHRSKTISTIDITKMTKSPGKVAPLGGTNALLSASKVAPAGASNALLAAAAKANATSAPARVAPAPVGAALGSRRPIVRTMSSHRRACLGLAECDSVQ